MDKINSKKENERRIVQCNRCNFKWATIQERPLCCANCGTPYWDKERRENKK
jgi:ribosomal protein L37E